MLGKHVYHRKNAAGLVASLLLLLTLQPTQNLLGQTGVIRANRVWSGIVENGGTGNFNYAGGWFPADYNPMGPSLADGSSITGSSIIMATINWTDPDGVLIPKAVIRLVDVYTNWSIDVPMTNSIRWGYPQSIIGYADVTMADWADENPDLLVGTSDQTAEVTATNSFGVEIHRKVFAWSQKFHDNYIVVDIELTNKSGSTLDSFYVAMHEGPIYWRKAKGSQGTPAIPDQDEVERAMAWHHYYGARASDSLRIFYMYHADDPDRPGDQMGGPVTAQDGRLLESDIAYYTIIHASAAPYTDPADDVDDFLQPRVTDVYNEAIMGVEAAWGGTSALGRDLIYDLMAGSNYDNPDSITGQVPGTYHRGNSDEQGDPDYSVLGDGFSKTSIGHRSVSSFGPYTFGPGEKLHFVYASGYTGLGIEKEKEIGGMWLNNTLTDAPNLPDANSGYFPSNFAYPTDASDIDKIKDRWISTGIDSVHQAASRAKWNFEHNWQIPGSPAPPSQEITGFGDGVEIKWSDPEAEALDGFVGYRIMSRVGQQDTVFFDVVHETDATDLAAEHVWKDTNILFGASYYYVQAGYRVDVANLNAHPDSRGQIIWSSRLWTPTTVDVQPPRLPGTTLDEIRIVPNPYNIRDPLIEAYGWNGNRGIIFFNLPAEVTIKIFTESGDIVKIIEHMPLSKAGSFTWDMLSSSQQAISTGVYIAVFQRPDGEVAYQKFIVVR